MVFFENVQDLLLLDYLDQILQQTLSIYLRGKKDSEGNFYFRIIFGLEYYVCLILLLLSKPYYEKWNPRIKYFTN